MDLRRKSKVLSYLRRHQHGIICPVCRAECQTTSEEEALKPMIPVINLFDPGVGALVVYQCSVESCRQLVEYRRVYKPGGFCLKLRRWAFITLDLGPYFKRLTQAQRDFALSFNPELAAL